MKKRKLKYLLISSSILLATGISFLYVNHLKPEETKANSNSISSNSDSENSESEFRYMFN